MKLNKFSKNELKALFVIFTILIVVSVPNFVSSLRRARNQTRKDDMASLKTMAENYKKDFGTYPLSTEDGRFLACIAPGDTVKLDEKGRLIANLIPCEWGKDSLRDLTPGSTKVYFEQLPGDPHHNQGVKYVYFSDGARVQIYAALEGDDDAEYDPKVVARNLNCGNEICNLGRGYGCVPEKSLAVCEEEQLLELKNKNDEKN